MKKWGRILNDSAADPPAVRRAGYPLRPVSPTGWKANIFSFITV